MDLTVLEFTVEEATITANAPFSGDHDGFEFVLGGDGDGRPIAALAGLLFLFVLAAVAKRRLRG